MKPKSKLLWLAVGLLIGLTGSALYYNPVRLAAAGDSRYEDYIMCTGRVDVRPGVPTDGVWILDYRTGKLLGTVIDRNLGKIMGWAEVDLVTEFGVQPQQNVHFMMTTGSIAEGQAALYVTETTTGKMGIYTMGPQPGVHAGIAIRRHDLVFFRAPKGN